MMCSAYFGELCEKRKENWNCGGENPYEILIFPITLDRKGHKLLSLGDVYFHDRINIDWGSFAWKCNSKEIISFLEDNKDTLPWLLKDEEQMIESIKRYISERGEVAYGVVFVEEV